MQNPPSQLIVSLLLAFVATIPNHTLRYTTLALAAALSVFYVIHVQAPSTQLRHLATFIDQTNKLIGCAMAQCSRDHLSLIKQTGLLLDIKQLIVQAEHQRKLTEDITEIQFILAMASTQLPATYVTQSNIVSQYSTHRSLLKFHGSTLKADDMSATVQMLVIQASEHYWSESEGRTDNPTTPSSESESDITGSKLTRTL
ncbi:hypothetical protein B0H19DRAFT_1061455 [Mycena capillaripes]|nr:hypothetical protein B0H19DRAFT_1061455 [Mycena capillaripes]